MHSVSERPSRTADADTDSAELLLFRLGSDGKQRHGELFGIHVGTVREIVAMPAVTALAGAGSHVLGLVNLRGQVIQVLDLPDMTGCIPSMGLNILLVTELGATTQAFAVESVDEIVVVASERLTPGEHGGGIVASIARLDDSAGGTRLVQVLDLAALLRMFRG